MKLKKLNIVLLSSFLLLFSCVEKTNERKVDSEIEALNDSLTQAAMAEYGSAKNKVSSEEVDTVDYVSSTDAKTMRIVFKNETSDKRTLEVKTNIDVAFIPFVFQSQDHNITIFKKDNISIEYDEETRNCTLVDSGKRTSFEMQ